MDQRLFVEKCNMGKYKGHLNAIKIKLNNWSEIFIQSQIIPLEEKNWIFILKQTIVKIIK